MADIVTMARNRDDAAPEWKWFWERLVAAWVPELDPWIVVGAHGSIPATYSAITNAKIAPGTEGNVEIVRGMVSGRIQVAPSFLTNNDGFTLFSMFRQRTTGNREVNLAGLNDGTSNAAVTYEATTGSIRRSLTPPGAFDGLSLTSVTGKKHVAMHLVRDGSQTSFLDGVQGTSYTSTFKPTWGTTDFQVGSTDGAMEMYVRMSASYAVIGRVVTREAQTFEALTRDLRPFRWKRRKTYIIPASLAATLAGVIRA